MVVAGQGNVTALPVLDLGSLFHQQCCFDISYPFLKIVQPEQLTRTEQSGLKAYA